LFGQSPVKLPISWEGHLSTLEFIIFSAIVFSIFMGLCVFLSLFIGKKINSTNGHPLVVIGIIIVVTTHTYLQKYLATGYDYLGIKFESYFLLNIPILTIYTWFFLRRKPHEDFFQQALSLSLFSFFLPFFYWPILSIITNHTSSQTNFGLINFGTDRIGFVISIILGLGISWLQRKRIQNSLFVVVFLLSNLVLFLLTGVFSKVIKWYGNSLSFETWVQKENFMYSIITNLYLFAPFFNIIISLLVAMFINRILKKRIQSPMKGYVI